MTFPLLALLLAAGPECLVLESSNIRASSHDAELSIRNHCGADAYALAAEIEWHFAGGSDKSESVAIDTWMSVAAAGALDVAPQWFVAGEIHKRLQRSPQDAAALNGISLKPLAVELADGRILGDAKLLDDLLAARKRSQQAWAHWERKLSPPLRQKKPLAAVLSALGRDAKVATPEDVAREELRRMVEQLQKSVLAGTSKEAQVILMLREYIALRAGR